MLCLFCFFYDCGYIDNFEGAKTDSSVLLDQVFVFVCVYFYFVYNMENKTKQNKAKQNKKKHSPCAMSGFRLL